MWVTREYESGGLETAVGEPERGCPNAGNGDEVGWVVEVFGCCCCVS